ncbi:hypothetical protein [Haloferula sp. A504]|uniref:hypothetical protein n=1 Tax=Haloferula sp. A504 TaxID=3373601 RepID=UPI0031CAD7AE|nr:hypothetical protein [Verrucomicrobiaceae bacterium E54]
MKLPHLPALVLFSVIATASAQVIVEDGFDSLPNGAFLNGATSGTGQWTGAWTIDDSQRLRIVSNPGGFGKTAPGLGSISGGPKSLELTTSTGSSTALRSYPPIDIPFYISFLLSVEGVGTGGGFIDLIFTKGAVEDVALRIIPDFEEESRFSFNYTRYASGYFANTDTADPQTLSSPYIVVVKIHNPEIAGWATPRFNPTAATNYDPKNWAGTYEPGFFDRIGLRVGRDSTSGTDSVFRIDELTVGLTRSSVLPDASPSSVMSAPTIEMIPRLSWYAAPNKTYYIQRSLNLDSWTTVTTLSGYGSQRQWADSGGPSKAFYRIVESP